LSPFDSLSFLTTLGFAAAYLAARRFGLALECADRALHDQPDWVVALRIKIVACARAGRLDEARGEVARLLSVYPKMTISRWRTKLSATSSAPEYVELNITGLQLAGLPE
jgi:tetratricopeptide (TPR) repeat protein